jgi:phosphoribosylaminoimidazole carboxylase PurE protein
MDGPLVGIVMGSESDREVMEAAAQILKELEIPHEILSSSAHRQPEKTREYATRAMERGIKVIIAGAGYAAHLPGVIASQTTLPVIGVPLASSPLAGIDSLLSIIQMPSGIPVATMGIGKSGAKNAALLAAEILALEEERFAAALEGYRQRLREK